MISRRNLVLGLGLGVAGTGVSTATYAAAVEPYSLVVTRYCLCPPGWPPTAKLKIAAIADLHAGGPNMLHERVREVVDTTNALNPDLTLLLGDYVADHHYVTEKVPPKIWGGELARLTAPLGVWAILGNHDWWQNIRLIRETLARANILVLENEAVRIGRDGARFWLAGLGDQIAIRLGPRRYRGVDNLPATLRQIGTDEPVILMAHEPDIFVRVPDRVSLTLAGHTHGGQVRIPFLWQAFLTSKYGARFTYGHVVEQDRHLVVSGGIGTSIIPLRLGVPPEVVLVELGGEPALSDVRRVKA